MRQMTDRALMRDLVDLLVDCDVPAEQLRRMVTMARGELLSALEDKAESLEERAAERAAENHHLDYADQYRPCRVTGDPVHSPANEED